MHLAVARTGSQAGAVLAEDSCASGTLRICDGCRAFLLEATLLQSPMEMAELLAAQLRKPLSAAGIRQLLHRAREKFADSLLQQVAQSLDEPTADRIEEELCELTLLEYCRPALQRQQPS